ncbi:nuclear transport factor 2 family protein [Ruegeria meonggei]|uniref:SnoaL-like domain protein n=1 Tax=Ruegeria meonggei TaxID=1446476 RepID=A0A1X6Y7I0_9RHOB|nr:nuclear transport factor 2 family protein [Ruegeria meonggei]SLN11286.1 SnoaL-like domain protein [Ruegeria meonggei]
MASLRDRLNNLARDYAIAWSSGDADAVASFFAPDGQIIINRGEPTVGRAAVAEMARGYYADFPDLEVRCDMLRWAGPHAIFVWTREGHHAKTGNHVVTRGWEEWEMTEDHKVQSSLGWFDAEDYQRQIAGI